MRPAQRRANVAVSVANDAVGGAWKGHSDEHSFVILTKDRDGETRHYVLDSQAALEAAVTLARAALDDVGITQATIVVPARADIEQ
jgi:hypothetical protein